MVSKPENISFIIILVCIGIILSLVIPLLPIIAPHPDEHEFFNNAWKIMAGKALHNYLHVAFTEYTLTLFLSFMNMVTRTGVNFPQGDPTYASFFFGRIFGLILWILTYLVGVFLLQKGKQNIRPRAIFFTVLYFGSVGLFERFLRVNSDSMSIFVAANYLLVSLLFHKKRSRPLHFFLINLFFVFLLSFTNLKALYLALPILTLNTLVPFMWYEKRDAQSAQLPMLYRIILYSIGIIFGSVILWYIAVPKPVDPNTFWYAVKHATVESVIHDYQYPGLAYNSWAVYLYDVFATHVGFSQIAAILLFIGITFVYDGKKLGTQLRVSIVRQFSLENFRSGNLYASLELILVTLFIVFYLGISSVVIHWSRWAVPLGFLFILIISPILEKTYYVLLGSRFNRRLLYTLFPILILISWSLLFTLLLSIKMADFPRANGMKLTVIDFNNFLKEKKISDDTAPSKIGSFYLSPDAVKAPVVDITTLGKLGTPNLDYYVWPQWGSNFLYSQKKRNSDLEAHNVKEFLDQYTSGIIWRFPSPISYYIHYTKWFAQGVLGLTWIPEYESMVETSYGILVMKHPNGPIKLHYEVPFSGLEHYYSPESTIFNLNTLHDTYIFPPCHGSPTVFEVDTGSLPPHPLDPLIDAPITNKYCHSVGIRMVFRGIYKIKIEGLPANDDRSQMVYSAYPMSFDSSTKTITMKFENTVTTAAFGVSTKEKYIPKLKFIIDYKPDYLPDKPITPAK